MDRILIAITVSLALSGCMPMDAERATRALESSGMHDVKLGGMAYFGCDEKDIFRQKFTATNAAGQHVSGVVCGGVFKGATVRFD